MDDALLGDGDGGYDDVIFREEALRKKIAALQAELEGVQAGKQQQTPRKKGMDLGNVITQGTPSPTSAAFSGFSLTYNY
jgi:hypothetical protein